MTIHHLIACVLFGLLVLLVSGCASSPEPDIAPGVSWKLAERRARTMSEIRYDLEFVIPESRDERIHGRETISLNLSDASHPLIIDFEESPESVRLVRANGEHTNFEFANGHIVVPASSLAEGRNTISIEFLAGDGPLNREDEYLYTLFVPDRASHAFPCFDQPNLKARFRLALDVPASWQAVSNGESLARQLGGDRALFTFEQTKPISTYLFSFAAGTFRVETAERGGRRMRMYHRETDAEKVARNTKAIFDLHETALGWLEEYTGIEYPFGKFDFILVPAFQFGGMEHPGAILYRASRLLLDESATQTQKLGRASLIAHETAHMWFGDLVTMNWFDDVWTKEVFANFMAAKIVNPSFPDINHELRFLLAHYPAAYEIDRTEGAHPIRQSLENLNEAGTLYGAIIYQKAPIVMKHLERLVGEESFRDGLREYLDRFRLANATWADLIDILDRRSDQDLKLWSHLWVEEAGRATITTDLSTNADGTIASLSLRQSDPRERGRVWNQGVEVLLAYPDAMRYVPVQLDDESALVREATGLPAPSCILANGRGIGYGFFELDATSRDFLLENLPAIKDELTRAIAWITLWDAMLEREVSPGALIELSIKALPEEAVELNVQRLLVDLVNTYWRYIPAGERERLAPELEHLLWEQMGRASTTSLKSTYFRAFRSIALTEAALQKLDRVWRQDLEIPGLPFSEQDFMTLALELAVREAPGWSEILQEQLQRIQNPERKAEFEFVMPAVSADPSVRDAFFDSLAEVENRQHEPWVLEAISYLHHPLRAEQSEKYILPSLELVQEIQRTGDIFFPKRWLDATLGGHSSDRAADIVRQFLADHPDYPPRLKGKILQSADQLIRAAAINQTERFRRE